MTTFYEFGISPELIRATASMGFEEATKIQELAIPLALTNRDIIGQAQTGTGKTAAFGLPMLEKCRPENRAIQGLVITPTRELAVQVAEELNTLGQFKNIRALPIYGGQDIERQIRALKNRPQVIVATPGRLMDHMRRKLIRLQQLAVVVLDEADEMLNMGFREDIETILAEVPAERQTMLFSATMPQPILDLARRFMQEPEFIQIKATGVTVPNTEQYYYQVHEREKFDALCRLLDLHSPEASIIFARTKRRVDELLEALIKRGYSAEAIHGDLTQAKRDSVMRKFKNGDTELLVATDVAARGLDIGSVTHIYNFDIPQDPESYVHRIGRTGRVGRAGLAATLVLPRELDHMAQIERTIKRKIIRQSVPTIDETIRGQQRLTIERLLEVVEAGDHQAYKDAARELLESGSASNLLAAALKLLTREPDLTPVSITADQTWFPKVKGQSAKPKRSSYRSKQESRKGKSGYRGDTNKKSRYRPDHKKQYTK
jgi:ATP-dependent RNA helicase DeaD